MAKPDSSDNGAKKRSNKSQAVRDVLAQSPKAKSKEIVALLAQKGVRVTPSLVYMVKSKLNRAQRRAKRARNAEDTRKAGFANPVELVHRVKELAREVGGLRKLKELVDLLAD
jgi:hypothetical protein